MVRTWISLKGYRAQDTWTVPRPSCPPHPLSDLMAKVAYCLLSHYAHIDHRALTRFSAFRVEWSAVWQSLSLWRYVRSVQDTAWSAFHGILPTADRLVRFKMPVSPFCFCGKAETLMHPVYFMSLCLDCLALVFMYVSQISSHCPFYATYHPFWFPTFYDHPTSFHGLIGYPAPPFMAGTQLQSF